MQTPVRFWFAVLLLAWGDAQDDKAAEVPPPDVVDARPPVTQLRVDLFRDEAGVVSTFDAPSPVSRALAEGAVAPSGNAIVVAYAGDRILGFDVVRFPRTARLEDPGDRDSV